MGGSGGAVHRFPLLLFPHWALLPLSDICVCDTSRLHRRQTRIGKELPAWYAWRARWGAGMTTKRGKLPVSDAAISIRLPTDIIKRADALVAPLAQEAALQGITRVGRSVVIKRALIEGL